MSHVTTHHSDEPAQNVQRSISDSDLIFEIHALLLEMRDENDVIITHKGADALTTELLGKLRERYIVQHTRVDRMFGILVPLGMRGSARKLALSGMEVFDSLLTTHYLQAKQVAKEMAQAQVRIAELELEVAEIHRLRVQNTALRQENRVLLALRENVSLAIAESYKNENE